MKLTEVMHNKKDYLDLLLLGDEQESMIDKYLQRGHLFALFDEELKAVCVVTKESENTCELKNIAVVPHEQSKGYGQKIIAFVCQSYQKEFDTMIVGTGNTVKTLSFYQKCGFKKTSVIQNFFTDYYDHPIFEDGKQLVDMIYLSKNLNA